MSSYAYTKGGHVKLYSGVDDLTSIDAEERLHLGAMGKQVRAAVTKAIRTGVLPNYGGKSGYVYKILTEVFRLPRIQYAVGDALAFDNHGYSRALIDELYAMHKLSVDPQGKNNGAYYRGGTNNIQGKNNGAYYRGGTDNIQGCRIPVDVVRKIIAKEYNEDNTSEIEDALMAIRNNEVLSFTYHIGV